MKRNSFHNVKDFIHVRFKNYSSHFFQVIASRLDLEASYRLMQFLLATGSWYTVLKIYCTVFCLHVPTPLLKIQMSENSTDY